MVRRQDVFLPFLTPSQRWIWPEPEGWSSAQTLTGAPRGWGDASLLRQRRRDTVRSCPALSIRCHTHNTEGTPSKPVLPEPRPGQALCQEDFPGTSHFPAPIWDRPCSRCPGQKSPPELAWRKGRHACACPSPTSQGCVWHYPGFCETSFSFGNPALQKRNSLLRLTPSH